MFRSVRISNFYFLCLVTCCSTMSCVDQNEKTVPEFNTKPSSTNRNLKPCETKDSILVTNGVYADSCYFSSCRFDSILTDHPELLEKYPQHPDLLYHCYGEKGEFNSELGQDTYYSIYAYLLRKRNGIGKISVTREKLTDLYNAINDLFAHFRYGGTYFIHQNFRIPAYVEYSLDLRKFREDYSNDPLYDISDQKDFYINSLRQMIADESSVDFMTMGKKQIKRNNDLNKIVDLMDANITDAYLLRMIQEFHYSHYIYF